MPSKKVVPVVFSTDSVSPFLHKLTITEWFNFEHLCQFN